MNLDDARTIANKAIAGLLGDHNDRNSQAIELPERVFHYTSIEGLRGILKNGVLWATSALFLNDSSELQYGSEMALGAIRLMQATNAGQRELLQQIENSISGLLSRSAYQSPIYVTCFCSRSNVLSQWREYGRTGGYCLGFDVEWHGMTVQPDPPTYTSSLVPVEYVPHQQIRLCQEILTSALDLLADNAVSAALLSFPSNSVFGFGRFRSYVEDMLLEQIARFKHPAFEEENEWRLVSRVRDIKKQANDDGGRKTFHPHFRNSHGVPVPYIHLHPTGDRLPIASVQIGPTLRKETVAGSLRMLLASHHFEDVSIDGSEIPVTF